MLTELAPLPERTQFMGIGGNGPVSLRVHYRWLCHMHISGEYVFSR